MTEPAAAPTPRDAAAEARYAHALIERIVSECPRRHAGSDSERHAFDIVRAELERLGFATTSESFEYCRSVYHHLALHYGVANAATLLSIVAPALAAPLHALVGVSHILDSHSQVQILRRLLPRAETQNLLVTLPAAGGASPALRLVVPCHVDAAFTGWVFDPRLVERMSRLRARFGGGAHGGGGGGGAGSRLPSGLRAALRPLALAAYSQLAQAALAAVRALLGPLGVPLIPLSLLLDFPALVAFVLNLQVVLNDTVVPGAADNLSGVAGMLLLMQRLAESKPDNVELVFVVTGAEEAGLGGARELAISGRWPTDNTVVLALDTISNGELRTLEEGDIIPRFVAPWLVEALEAVRASEARFADVAPFRVPVGGSDVAAFLARGYDGVCLVCIDPVLGSPRHYHQLTDTPDNIEPEMIVKAVDFAERLVDEIYRRKL